MVNFPTFHPPQIWTHLSQIAVLMMPKIERIRVDGIWQSPFVYISQIRPQKYKEQNGLRLNGRIYSVIKTDGQQSETKVLKLNGIDLIEFDKKSKLIKTNHVFFNANQNYQQWQTTVYNKNQNYE